MRGYFLNGAGDVAEVLRAIGAQQADIFGGADGMMHDGAFSGLKFEVEAHGLKRQQQVGEDDRRIDTEFLGGRNGDFCGEFRLLADFDKGVMLANISVLLHVAAGLAQEPYRCAIDGAAQAGADKSAAGPSRIVSTTGESRSISPCWV